MPVPDPSTAPSDIDRILFDAREHARAGRIAAAEDGFRRVLSAHPDRVDALLLLARITNARGDRDEAVILFSRAAQAAPQNAGVLAELGATYRDAERFDAARYTLERAARLGAGRNPSIRLLLANTLERDARPELALFHYSRAMLEARQLQRWVDPGDEAPDANHLIPHAARYVATGRRAWFEQALAPLRQQAPAARWDRIDTALAVHLGEREPVLDDPHRQTGFFHVPGISTARFPDAHLAWIEDARLSLTGLGDEIDACLAATQSGDNAGVATLAVRQRGNVQYEARRHAPRLLAMLEDLPLARIPNHAPDIYIVALAAGARLAQHERRTNSLCATVISLDNGSVDVIVGGEQRALPADAHLVFDPGFGVEYHNTGETSARLVVLDVWHPDLSFSEQQAISALLVAASDFDTRLQELD